MNNNQQDTPSSQPTKRLKPDHNQQQESPQLFCNCFTEEQTNQLLGAVLALKNYIKYVSVLIRHQERSLESLPKQLLQRQQFKQLTQRIPKCIQHAKPNNQLLKKILTNYSPYLHKMSSPLSPSPSASTQQSSNAGSVMSLFVHIVREWSIFSQPNIRPMKNVVALMRKYWAQQGQQGEGEGDGEGMMNQKQMNQKQMNQKNQKKKKRVFVQGVGLGRIVAEIWEQMGEGVDVIEGSEDRVLHYICSQYFLSTYKITTKTHTIYPFIHDFTNRQTTTSPYLPIQIPYFPSSSSRSSANIRNPPPLSQNLCTFEQFYKSNHYNNQWDILVSYLCNDRVTNLLKWIQVVYKGLVENGKWIIAAYSSWQHNVIPMTYQQVRNVLEKSMFKILQQSTSEQYLINGKSMTKQKLKIFYIVLVK